MDFIFPRANCAFQQRPRDLPFPQIIELGVLFQTSLCTDRLRDYLIRHKAIQKLRTLASLKNELELASYDNTQ